MSCSRTLTTLTTMVRLHLEYGNVIWYPRFRRDSQEIENIQRRATNLIPKLKHLPYDNRLKALKLPSLHHRRRRGDMIQIYNILNEIDRIDRNIFFEQSSGSSTRGHSQKLVKNMLGWEFGSQSLGKES